MTVFYYQPTGNAYVFRSRDDYRPNGPLPDKAGVYDNPAALRDPMPCLVIDLGSDAEHALTLAGIIADELTELCDRFVVGAGEARFDLAFRAALRAYMGAAIEFYTQA